MDMDIIPSVHGNSILYSQYMDMDIIPSVHGHYTVLPVHGYGYYPLSTRTLYCTHSTWIWILSPQFIDFTESQKKLYFKI